LDIVLPTDKPQGLLYFVVGIVSFLLQTLAYIWLREGLVMSVIFSILFGLTAGVFLWTYCFYM
jgi:uncharacterized membrane protein YhhN